MREEWVVFTNKETGKELCSYTTRGTFPGELEATRAELAAENGLQEEQIETHIETRQ